MNAVHVDADDFELEFCAESAHHLHITSAAHSAAYLNLETACPPIAVI
jgi:hypothetical protein